MVGVQGRVALFYRRTLYLITYLFIYLFFTYLLTAHR